MKTLFAIITLFVAISNASRKSYARFFNDDDDLLILVLLPESTSPICQCMDGTMAGYDICLSSNTKIFIIDLKGGGACTNKEDCDKRSKSKLGSSNEWDLTMHQTSFLQITDCKKNPDFCNAMTVHILYCTRPHVATPAMHSSANGL